MFIKKGDLRGGTADDLEPAANPRINFRDTKRSETGFLVKPPPCSAMFSEI